MSFDRGAFEQKRRQKTAEQASDVSLQELALRFVIESDKKDYAYQWTWMGLPIIQLPSDIMMTQEIIWRERPDVIIETGVAWGGSVALYASLLDLMDRGIVIGIDLNLHENVVSEVEALAVADRIRLIKGDSTSPVIKEQVAEYISETSRVMVLLDSNHTHQHVLEELRAYAPLVTPGQYVVVSDTIVEYLPAQEHRPRPWGKGNNPKTAVDAYLAEDQRFIRDREISDRLLETLTPGGYLRRIR